MMLTHNCILDEVAYLRRMVNKGVPFASREKERNVRRSINRIWAAVEHPPTFGEVWGYFLLWLVENTWVGRLWAWLQQLKGGSFVQRRAKVYTRRV